eukprot:365563-Chlamydomonas_euryale.AAC.10
MVFDRQLRRGDGRALNIIEPGTKVWGAWSRCSTCRDGVEWGCGETTDRSLLRGFASSFQPYPALSCLSALCALLSSSTTCGFRVQGSGFRVPKP